MDGRIEQTPARTIEYPESDGQPMGETDLHRDEMILVIEVLKSWFADREDVYVSGNNFIYYEEGEPKRCVSPDGYVVRGVGKHQRRTFKVWEEGGRTPCVVIEVTSRKTHRKDHGRKRAIYEAELRVPEYFLYDPEGDWIAERLRGYRLGESGEYERLEPVEGRLSSRELHLELLVRDGHLRFLDPATGQLVPTKDERLEQERARADERLERERDRADAAEARARALEAELERLRRERSGDDRPTER